MLIGISFTEGLVDDPEKEDERNRSGDIDQLPGSLACFHCGRVQQAKGIVLGACIQNAAGVHQVFHTVDEEIPVGILVIGELVIAHGQGPFFLREYIRYNISVCNNDHFTFTGSSGAEGLFIETGHRYP